MESIFSQALINYGIIKVRRPHRIRLNKLQLYHVRNVREGGNPEKKEYVGKSRGGGTNKLTFCKRRKK